MIPPIQAQMLASVSHLYRLLNRTGYIRVEEVLLELQQLWSSIELIVAQLKFYQQLLLELVKTPFQAYQAYQKLIRILLSGQPR